MAVGAKLYLAAPDALAGDVGLILLTFGVLQAYELAVAGVLILLHRARRSPEDEPSLLWVAALFWTGPLAAGLELTANDARLGLCLAVGTCVLAVAELHIVRRLVELRLSWAGQLAAMLCVALVAIAPLRLRVPYATAGTDEVALYACWWLLAGLALLVLPAIRRHARAGTISTPNGLRTELGFLVTVLVAGGVHLYAMNYAFCGHAGRLYAAPLVAVAAAAGFEYLAVAARQKGPGLAVCTILPVLAMLLTHEGFDASFPVERLPGPMRNPLVPAIACAAGVWWYGYARHRLTLLLHGGCLAAAAALYLSLSPVTIVPERMTWPPTFPLPLNVAWAAWGLTAYLLLIALIRRSRFDLVAALLVNACAIAAFALGRTTADGLVLLTTIGWTGLIAVQVASRRPPWAWQVVFVLILMSGSCVCEFDASWQWPARLHAVTSAAALAALGCGWAIPRFCYFAGLAIGVWLLAAGAHGLSAATNPAAAMAAGSAFLLLLAAAATSWHKRRLLALTRVLGQQPVAIREDDPTAPADDPWPTEDQAGETR
jgi:hypothetical protein